jgi:hypothetical protein
MIRYMGGDCKNSSEATYYIPLNSDPRDEQQGPFHTNLLGRTAGANRLQIAHAASN